MALYGSGGGGGGSGGGNQAMFGVPGTIYFPPYYPPTTNNTSAIRDRRVWSTISPLCPEVAVNLVRKRGIKPSQTEVGQTTAQPRSKGLCLCMS